MILSGKQIITGAFALTSLLSVSCTQNGTTASSEKDSLGNQSADSVKSVTTVASAQNLNYTPNELGKVMVLEYHLIGYPEDRWRRTPENFRKDLQMLYDNDFYPVSVLDIAYGNLNVPAGKTPFAITLDDSSAGQFRYIEKNGQLVIDPECALGIMEDFKKKYKDFPVTATFYVLPAIKPTLRLFAQPEYKKQKLEWLEKNGYEIGSHNWYHSMLSKLSDAGVQEHLSMFVKEIREFLPNYEVKTMALPLGMHAKNRALEVSGEFEGTKYNHQAVMLVGSVSSVSPYSKDFNRLAIQRVQAGEHTENPETFMKSQIKHQTRFVSDGDPKTISAPEKLRDQLKPGLEKKYQVKWIKEKENTVAQN
ncbi:polysaccharide deacetylase family protein [Daejeonella oryzae]|uniref:polysaccharide deacetylase family protein n=1 Tax=Daejeonella oryzae TaxID=1122943 RepID=UPI00040CF822|nr:polysaccharide deacetylase family protein [Daejeonella oryzae]